MKSDARAERGPLFDALWDSYAAITPQAEEVFALLGRRGDRIVNDHVALRTYDRGALGLERTARPFVELGFEPRDSYTFEDKKLRARYFQHPDPLVPKVFISELEVDAMPGAAREIIDELVAQVPAELTEDPLWVARGRIWSVTRQQVLTLAEVSEYASWVAVHGLRANHFTVDVGSLDSVADLADLVEVLQQAGLRLNDSGGIIKGGPEVYLAQASTRADTVTVVVDDGEITVPSCYVEFAQRYPMPDGELYQGFVAGSADKIFESTDRGQ